MAKTVPELPYKTPLLDESGTYLSRPWAGWFRDMFSRIGGTVALTNVELADLSDTQVAALQVNITALQASVVTLSAQITALQSSINDLNQKRAL
jgi:hypothetical protein